MAVDKTITDFLKRAKAKYEIISHEPAFTAQEVAAKTHIRGRDLAKAVILKAGGKLAMAVLPAPASVDFRKFAEACGAKRATLAKEEDFVGRFPGCDAGAEPPLGKLYDMPVYVDGALARDEEIAFNAGTHTDVIRMKYADYEKVASAKVADISAEVG